MGRKEAAFRDAEAREREAEARATTMVPEAIARGDIQAVSYFVAHNDISALRHIGSAHNQKLVLLPLAASRVIGSIAGVAELANAAQGKRDQA